MNIQRTRLLQEIRMHCFHDVLSHWTEHRLSQEEAARLADMTRVACVLSPFHRPIKDRSAISGGNVMEKSQPLLAMRTVQPGEGSAGMGFSSRPGWGDQHSR